MAPFKKASIPADVRRDVARRYGCEPGGSAGVECHYCRSAGSIYWFFYGRGKGWPAFSLEMDHVVPEIAGGESRSDNIVLACRPCNRSKGSKRLEEWRA